MSDLEDMVRHLIAEECEAALRRVLAEYELVPKAGPLTIAKELLDKVSPDPMAVVATQLEQARLGWAKLPHVDLKRGSKTFRIEPFSRDATVGTVVRVDNDPQYPEVKGEFGYGGLWGVVGITRRGEITNVEIRQARELPSRIVRLERLIYVLPSSKDAQKVRNRMRLK